jgi:zinc transport system permease protein
MIVPNATAQLVAGSFRSAIRMAVVIGVVCSVGGVTTSYYADSPAGATIVLIAIALFLAAASYSSVHDRIARQRHLEAERHEHEHGPNCGHLVVEHDNHVDYLHDGHHHAPHQGHYDEHDLALHGTREHLADPNPPDTHDDPLRP